MTDFWKTKPLAKMSEEEWESLCDGCGQCCLVKLEDEDNGEIFYTDIVCYLLDQDSCTCGDYQQRCVLVPDCVKLTPTNLEGLSWMPADCAYRRLAEGQDLAWWHPLVSGSSETVHESGVSVRGKVVIETEVDSDELEDHIVDWVR
ncbi:MAG TPA: YcgN family cysteine cluster protein [Gammaproteobacteria bacterium]|nr:YcgN family cysteine cluster protein [Gammaproteobacteria bacterium]